MKYLANVKSQTPILGKVITAISDRIISILCILIAAYIAINGGDSWGYFLFVGFLTAD